jgi:alpha-tubulin suppressor-like RCC1 family protein
MNGNCGACATTCATDCVAASPSFTCNDPVEIAAGSAHTCAVRGDGSLWCWGLNNWGQVGTGSGVSWQFVPAKIDLPFSKVLHISARGNATCALGDTGRIACWGVNGNNQSTPTLYDGASAPTMVQAVAVGGIDPGGMPGSSLVLHTSAGTVSAFLAGGNQPSLTNKLVAATSIAAGGGHACAIGSLAPMCWGDNSFAQLGTGSAVPSSATNPIQISGFMAKMIAAGAAHTCAIKNDDTLWCWGKNDQHQVSGTTNPQPALTQVIIPGNPPLDAVVLGDNHSAVVTEGNLYLWGDNASNQVDASAMDVAQPVLSTNAQGVTSVALGGAHTCALLQSGVMKCWGSNVAYQLGDGTQISSPTALDVKWK